MRSVATDVREAVVPGAGHWLMEERPAATVALIEGFLMDQTPPGAAAVRPVDERRVTPNEFKFSEGGGPVRVLRSLGDPNRRAEGRPGSRGLYTIMLQVPAHTRIAPHDHQDDRVATVIAGTWFLGYGRRSTLPS